MDSLMERIERDGRDVARRFQIERDRRYPPDRREDTGYLRGELAGLSRAAWYITGEDIGDVERRWIAETVDDVRRTIAALAP